MHTPIAVSDLRANANELIQYAVQTIGRSVDRRLVFEAIYYHKKHRKFVSEVCTRTGLSRMRVLQEANALAVRRIVGKIRERGVGLLYEQDTFYQAHKEEILRQLDDPERGKSFPTKRNPTVAVSVVRRGKKPAVHANFITVDEIDSFRKVRKISKARRYRPLPESRVKQALQRIIGEDGRFSDWGGEDNDLFSTHLRISNKRMRAAFVLKGPGAMVKKLTLRQLGKNADQILRLFRSAASVFLVQFEGQIDSTLVSEMETHARDLSVRKNQTVWFGIIDGKDTRRLRKAYPAAFN